MLHETIGLHDRLSDANVGLTGLDDGPDAEFEQMERDYAAGQAWLAEPEITDEELAAMYEQHERRLSEESELAQASPARPSAGVAAGVGEAA